MSALLSHDFAILMRGKSLTCRWVSLSPRSMTATWQISLLVSGYMLKALKLTISKDHPCLFITAVAKDRLPVFRTNAIKTITCNAIDEARSSCGFLLFAYVIMPDHIHLITDSPRKPSTVLQFIKGIVSRRGVGYLKEKNYETSLRKLEHGDWKRNHRYSLWQHDSDVFSIVSESAFMQKVNYIHQNPVRAKLVEHAEDFLWSSARSWQKCPKENEPLSVDIDKIVWRMGRRPG